MPKDLIADRVRIGINPGAGADPQLNSDSNLLNIAGNGADANAWLLNYSNSPGGFNLRLGQARGTAAAPVILQNGDYVFELEAFAFNGVSFTEGAEVKVTVDTGTGGAIVPGQAIPTRLEFWTNVVNTTPALKAFITAFGTLETFTPVAGGSGFRLPHGAAPSAPVNGDLWTTTTGLLGRINGVTQQYAPLASPSFTGTVNAAALTMTGALTINNAAAQILNSGTANNTTISSAATIGSSQGAYLRLYGQTAAGTPGDIDLVCGSSGTFRFYASGVAAITVPNTGIVTFNNTTDSTSITTGAAIFSGGVGVAKRLTLDGATGKTLRIVNGVAPAAVAVTIGLGPTGSTAGTPVGWMRIDINGTDRYMPFW